jgi:hypothetical protein
MLGHEVTLLALANIHLRKAREAPQVTTRLSNRARVVAPDRSGAGPGPRGTNDFQTNNQDLENIKNLKNVSLYSRFGNVVFSTMSLIKKKRWNSKSFCCQSTTPNTRVQAKK